MHTAPSPMSSRRSRSSSATASPPARNTAGSEALTTYARTATAEKSQHAHLVPYVADMRRALGRFRKLTPEEATQKATERAAKATAKVAKATAKAAKLAPAPPANPAPTTQQSS